MSRYNSKVSRDTSFSTFSIEEPSWAADYLAAVEKYSVKSKQDDQILINQINQILGNTKSKYSSVEEAVLDMQKRTGLINILQKKANQNDMFEEFPELKDFIEEKVKAFPGSAVEAICSHILKEPKFKDFITSYGDVPSDVTEFINKCKSKYEKDKNSNADGNVDTEVDNITEKENNPFNFLSPSAI